LGRLAEALTQHQRIGVDTAPFIYLWEEHPRYFALSEELFSYLKTPTVQGYTSIVTLIEVCVYPQRQGYTDLIATYEQALLYSQQIQLLPVDIEIARQAVQLRATYNIHVPDALHIATALTAGATAFVTNDRRLTKVQEVKVLVLDDYTA